MEKNLLLLTGHVTVDLETGSEALWGTKATRTFTTLIAKIAVKKKGGISRLPPVNQNTTLYSYCNGEAAFVGAVPSNV